MTMEVMHLKGACELLGVGQTFIYKHIDEIPHGKCGSKLLFTKRALICFAEGRDPNDPEQLALCEEKSVPGEPVKDKTSAKQDGEIAVYKNEEGKLILELGGV